MLKKQETLLGRGNWMESSRVMEPGRTALASSLRFFGDGVSFRLSLANHLDLGSFLVVYAPLNQDGFQQEGFWDVVGHTD